MESENRMKRLCFYNQSELGQYMINKARNGIYIVAVLFYKDAIDLIRNLLSYSDVEVESLIIEPEEYGGYDREYYVSLADDMTACVEPAYSSNGKYLTTDADLTLIDGNASSTAIINVPKEKCIEICIGVKKYDFENYDLDKDDELDKIYEQDQLIKNYNDEVIGIKMSSEQLFNYLFH